MVRPREKMTERARAAQASPHPTGLQPDVTRRTTVILRSEDISNLKEIGAETGTTDTETIRRAIRLMKDLLLWQRVEGGDIVLEKNGKKERIRFL